MTTQNQMAVIGIIVGALGLVIGYLLLFLLGSLNYF